MTQPPLEKLKAKNAVPVFSIEPIHIAAGVSVTSSFLTKVLFSCKLYHPHNFPVAAAHLEQSAPTCHVRTLYVCLPRSPQSFSLQAFLPMTFTATSVVPVQ